MRSAEYILEQKDNNNGNKLSGRTVAGCGLALLMFFLLLGALIFGYVYFVKLGK